MGKMSEANKNTWLRLSPPLAPDGGCISIFHGFAKALSKLRRDGIADSENITQSLKNALAKSDKCDRAQAPMLTAALLVLSDLGRQGWEVRMFRKGVEVRTSGESSKDLHVEKDRVREQEKVKREEQLRQPSVQNFIKSMERKRIYHESFVSIFSLFRDGRELSKALRNAQGVSGADQQSKLREVIDPYLQFVTEGARCQHTGLKLQNVWRYFRHTWANQYTTTPGRTMAFIVRDRASSMHPVIGIGAIGSSIVQIKERDKWIGWDPQEFLAEITAMPTAEVGRWLIKTVDGAIEEVYKEDLLEEGVLAIKDLREPTEEILSTLLQYSEEQRKLHHRFVKASEHKRNDRGNEGWKECARSHLFRSKRTLLLAEMLKARAIFNRFFDTSPTAESLAALLKDKAGKDSIRKVLRKAKADRVGISMADIIVCGAVPPYNPILGGKLVSMLAASPEVVGAYKKRYAKAVSEIASGTAGRPIVRSPELVFLGTTSLYGVGSSQYNRLKLPAELLGGPKGKSIEYVKLGKSRAFGTSHFSNATVQSLVSLVQHKTGGQRVNSIFGEGVSPKLRKIRDGLDLLKFPTEDLLRHGRKRIIYGIPLATNLRNYLLGMEETPEYLFRVSGEEATNKVSAWWRGRWLANRIERDGVLEDVAAHTLIRPIRHGAKVRLPVICDDQGSLFDDLEY